MAVAFDAVRGEIVARFREDQIELALASGAGNPRFAVPMPCPMMESCMDGEISMEYDPASPEKRLRSRSMTAGP